MRVSTTGLLIALAALAAGCFDDPSSGPHPCDACLECESCVEGPDGPTCEAASHQSQVCVGDEVRWLDSCGADEGAAETCPEHSECIATTGSEAFCECTEHWEGEGCDVCPGNWDAAQDCVACETNWEGEDCETCPGNWDPEENCAVCLGNWDAAESCEQCLYHWIDEGNDCGSCPGHWDWIADCNACQTNWTGDDCEICPGNWDAAMDCNACETNWTGASCETCPDNWDATANCAACENHWIDEGDDCGTCPGNWDAAMDCNACETNWTGADCEICPDNWDATANCAACENHWIDEGDDCGTCPGKWDAAADCAICQGNWNEATDCTACDNHWIDEENDCGTCPDGWVDDCNVCVRYVDVDAFASDDGLSWDSAFLTVQEGIDAAWAATEATDGPESCEVWVKGGDYYIYVSDNADTVQLRSNVHLYGGFLGDEIDREERDVVANATTLSGHEGPSGTMHACTAVTVSGTDITNVVLDGFTIRDGGEIGVGCSGLGGGIRISNTPSFEVSIRRCVFMGNVAQMEGGAIYSSSGAASFSDCVFTDNRARSDGSVISGYSIGTITFSNSLIYDNVSSWGTCSVFHTSGGRLNLVNVVIYGNTTSTPGTGNKLACITNYGDFFAYNSIFWSSNPSGLSASTSSDWGFTYCDVDWLAAADTNISSDPLFVDAANGDFHLQSPSPCIDAADGDPARDTDYDGNPRVDDPSVPNTGGGTPDYTDIGAYEYQP